MAVAHALDVRLKPKPIVSFLVSFRGQIGFLDASPLLL